MPPFVSSKLRQTASKAPVAQVRSGKHIFGHDLVSVLSDLFVVWDVAMVFGTGVLAWLACVYAHGAATTPALEWAELRPIVIMASFAAPFALRDQRTAWSSGALRGAGIVGRAMGRVALLLGLIWAVEITSRTAGDLPLRWLTLWSAGIVAFLVQPRATMVGYLRRLDQRGVLVQSVAVVGAGEAADRLIRHLRSTRGQSVNIIGVFDDRAERLPAGAVMPQGDVDDLIALAQEQRVDWIVITLPWSAEARVAQILGRLKALAVEVALCPPLVGSPLPRREVDVFEELPLGLIAQRPLRSWNVLLKEAEDKVLGALLIVLLAPVLALIALAVRLDSRGPILFRQERVGLNNRPFNVLKFRSMHYQPECTGDIQQTKRGKDARITPVGAFLRKSSLDELPQLFNVLRGEMSLVGPRPHALTMRTQDLLCDEIVEDYKHRHRMKPGMTGWAQVNGLRGATDTTEQLRNRVEHDLYYIENWSLWLDMKILVMTPLTILSGENAF